MICFSLQQVVLLIFANVPVVVVTFYYFCKCGGLHFFKAE